SSMSLLLSTSYPSPPIGGRGWERGATGCAATPTVLSPDRGEENGSPSSLLLDIPHHRHGRLQPADNVGAGSARPIPLADPAILRGFERAVLHRLGKLLAFDGIGLLGIAVAQLLH